MCFWSKDPEYGEKYMDPEIVVRIESDGRWTPKSCSECSRAEAIDSYGRMFASQLFYHKLWEEGDGVRFKVWTDVWDD